MSNAPILHGGHAVARALKSAGVKCVYTLCGGHICAIYDGCFEEGIEVVDVRHEQAAVHAADGYARMTRGLGVALLTAGPGVTDAVTGVVNAAFASSPVLIVAGAPAQKVMGKGALQEMDQAQLFENYTKGRFHVDDPNRIGEIIGQAVQLALSGIPGPVYVEVPFDVVTAKEVKELKLHQTLFQPPLHAVDPQAIDRLAALVHEAKKPVLFLGSSIWWDDATAAAQRLAAIGLPVFVNGMARGVLRPGHPSLFMHAREQAFRNCDLLILVGAPLDFRMGYGANINEAAKLVQIDRDPRNFGKNRRCDLPIYGDSRAALTALADALDGRSKGPRFADWAGELRKKESEKQEKQRAYELDDRGPMNQYRLGRAIADILDEDTIIVGDGGYVVTLAAKVIQPHAIGNWLDPSPFGTLGVGPPFALAAKMVRPKAHVVLLLGDGSFGLNGFDLETCVRFGHPVTVVVGNDAAWGQILVPQIQAFGAKRAVGSRLAPIRYDEIVRVFGGDGEHVDTGPELDKALRRARDSGKVYAIDAAVDQEFVLREGLARTAVY